MDIPWSKTILYPKPVDVDTEHLHPIGFQDYRRTRKRQRAEFAFGLLTKLAAEKNKRLQAPPTPAPPPSPKKPDVYSEKELEDLLDDAFAEVNVEKELFPSEESYISSVIV